MTSWSGYLQRFHTERAGVTENLLERCADDHGEDPYQWLLAAVPPTGVVLDVGCGSGPVAPRVAGWVGVDVSEGELALARRRGRTSVIAGRAEQLPIATQSVATTVGLMSLMVVADPAATLEEMARILRPGGRLALLLPDTGPLNSRDCLRYGVLLALVGRRAAPFPQHDLAARLPALLATAGFMVLTDHRRRFACPMGSHADADRLVDSLYLPGVAPARLAAARAAVRRWGDTPLGLPLRRVAAVLSSPH